MPTEFMKVKEIANLLGLSVMTIYREIEEGRLHAMRFGRTYRVAKEDYEAYLKASEVEPREAANG